MNAIGLIKKLPGVSTVTKSRAGFLIALVAILSVLGKEAAIPVATLGENGGYVCLGIALFGCLSWTIGLGEGLATPCWWWWIPNMPSWLWRARPTS
jgi:hypothetical protein